MLLLYIPTHIYLGEERRKSHTGAPGLVDNEFGHLPTPSLLEELPSPMYDFLDIYNALFSDEFILDRDETPIYHHPTYAHIGLKA